MLVSLANILTAKIQNIKIVPHKRSLLLVSSKTRKQKLGLFAVSFHSIIPKRRMVGRGRRQPICERGKHTRRTKKRSGEWLSRGKLPTFHPAPENTLILVAHQGLKKRKEMRKKNRAEVGRAIANTMEPLNILPSSSQDKNDKHDLW